MSLRTRLIEIARSVGKFQREVREALSGGAVGSWGSDDPELAGYRRLSDRVLGSSWRRDLSDISIAESLRIGHWLYTSNGLAEWLINVRADMVVGAELTYSLEFDPVALRSAPDEAKALEKQARRYLDVWWDHPAHSFQTKAAEYATTYLLTGELLLNIPEGQTNEVTGLFTLDYIDNEAIARVEPRSGLATTPGTVFVRQGRGGTPVALRVMAPDAAGAWEGQCFFFRHARRLNALRGLSDLVSLADGLDLLDQFMFSVTDRALLVNNLVHDLTVKGAGEARVLEEEAKRFRQATIKPGGVYAHNDQIAYQQVAPDLQAAQQAELAEVLLVRMLGARGIPRYWYSSGAETNLATAVAQGSAALQMLQALQTELRRIFERPLQVAYDRLQEKQRIFPRRAEGGVKLAVNMPVLSTKDVARLSAAFAQLETALGSAQAEGRISRATAQRVLAGVLDSMGFAVDPDEEAQRIAAEAEEREEADAARGNAVAKRRLDAARGDEGGEGGDEGDDNKGDEGKSDEDRAA